MTIEAEHPSPEPAPEADARARIPRHIAIIMDGHGRWAERRGLPRLAGHRAGTENIRRTLQTVYRAGIPYLTLFAFSTEVVSRPLPSHSPKLAISRLCVAWSILRRATARSSSRRRA